MQSPNFKMSRRGILLGTAAAIAATPTRGRAQDTVPAMRPEPDLASRLKLAFTVNGVARELEVDTRTTLLDALRENLHLTGTKKGCSIRGNAGHVRCLSAGVGWHHA